MAVPEFFRNPSGRGLQRLRHWTTVTDYAGAEILRHGPIDVVRYPIRVDLHRLTGRKLAFISDVHPHAGKAARHRTELVAQLLRELAPDYLLLGGDMIYDSCDLAAFHELLGKIRDIAPTMAIPGNWERGKEWLSPAFWRECYRKYGMHFLCNRGYADGDFFFYGVDDFYNGYPRLPALMPENETFNILLAHNPDTVIGLDTEDALRPYRLILCGHTHGGQIRLPFLGPLYTSCRCGLRLACGRFRREGFDSELIVSCGIGNRRFPGRFRCRREIVLIEFTPASL